VSEGVYEGAGSLLALLSVREGGHSPSPEIP